jgi:hypothetical protein
MKSVQKCGKRMTTGAKSKDGLATCANPFQLKLLRKSNIVLSPKDVRRDPRGDGKGDAPCPVIIIVWNNTSLIADLAGVGIGRLAGTKQFDYDSYIIFREAHTYFSLS